MLVGTARLAAQDVSKNLDDMLSFVCNVLALESGNEILDGLLTDKGPSESEFNDGVKLLKKLVATSNLVSAARVYNTQGKCIVSDTGITNIDVKDRDYFKKVMLLSLRHYKASLYRVATNDYSLAGLKGKELKAMTVGVVGTGGIGSCVVRLLAGFGCRVLAYNKSQKPDLAALAEYTDMPNLQRALLPAP